MRWTREAKNGYVIDGSGRDVHGDVNLDFTQRYRSLCPRLVRLASRAANIEEAYVLVKSVAEQLEKQVEDIAKKFSSVNLDNSKSQVSFTGGNEIMDHGEPIKNLLENVKGLKKREGRKGGKRPKSWVEQQPRRKKKSPTKDNTRQQLSKENNCSSLIHHNNSITHMQCCSHKLNTIGTEQAPHSVAWTAYEGSHENRCQNNLTESPMMNLLGLLH